MNFDQLPKELIANIASCLNYEDTCNLMETSKKCYHAIKEYRMDRIKLNIKIHFGVGHKDAPKIQTFEASTKKEYKLKCLTGNQSLFSAFKKILEKCENVDCVTFGADPFHTHRQMQARAPSSFSNQLIELIYSTQDRIRRVDVRHGHINLSEKGFIEFCKKFKGSAFSNCNFIFRIWSDQALTQILPFTKMFHGYVRDTCTYSETLLTDRTLKALITENEVQTNFEIPHVMNSFTIEQIVKNLEVLRERNINEVRWHFGTLPSSQRSEVEKYFNQENGELRDIYDIHIANEHLDGVYMLFTKPEDKRFLVNFFILPADA